MPGFDATGPMGKGPMTGGARGNCGTADSRFQRPVPDSGYMGRGMAYGRGVRGGFGYGRRPRRGFGRDFSLYPPEYMDNSVADELSILKQQAKTAQNTLDSINKKIAALEKID